MRIEERDGWFVIVGPSPVCGEIELAEWPTLEQAEVDLAMWLEMSAS